MQAARVSDCSSDKCLYKYLYNPDSLLNCIITAQKAVRFPGFPRLASYKARVRFASGHGRAPLPLGASWTRGTAPLGAG